MKLVVAIDTPESAKSALEYLTSGRYGKSDEIHLIHVVVPPGFADVTVAGLPDVVGEEKKEEQELLTAMAEVIKGKLAVTPSVEVVTGETADVIANICRTIGADEVIAPTHARHGLARLWYGSVADEIIETAPCTVVVLKMPAHAGR
jgi:nucleotide-binding universal stress UspA family protein